MTAKALVISNICSGLTKKICMLVNCFQDTGQNQKELNVLMWCLTRLQKIDSIVCSQGTSCCALPEPFQSCKKVSHEEGSAFRDDLPPFSGYAS